MARKGGEFIRAGRAGSVTEDELGRRVFSGYNGDLIVSDRSVVIHRGVKAFTGLRPRLIRGDKEIPFGSIVSVQLHRPTIGATGYLQIAVSGGPEAKWGLREARNDENTITFMRSQSALFDEARRLITERMLEASGSPDPEATKECPDCAETIKAVAKVCRLGVTQMRTSSPYSGLGDRRLATVSN